MHVALTQMVDEKAEEMAMPLGKKRILPEWMVGAGKRIGVGQKKKQTAVAAVAPVKVTARATAPKSATKTKAKR